MDELAQLRAFVRAAELGSFSRAAAEARVRPSSISRAISAMEADLGAALFNRSTRALHLTEAGFALLERARVVLSEMEEARAAVVECRIPGGPWPDRATRPSGPMPGAAVQPAAL